MADDSPFKKPSPGHISSLSSLSPNSKERLPSVSSPMQTRQSFSDQLRGVPPSPRSQRQPSISAQALQDLLNHPPLAQAADNAFTDRDWKTIKVGEVVDPTEVHWAESKTSVEDATNLLISGGPPNVVLVRKNPESHVAHMTFDYSDLNAYLLLVVGLSHPDEAHVDSFNELIKKGREGKPIRLEDIKDLGRKEAFITLPQNASLTHAVEIFGSGIHRIIIQKEGGQDVLGVLTQLRLVRFFWQNGRDFPAIFDLFPWNLKDLGFGARPVKSINGDRPLQDALEIMSNESITSLPVVDNSNNVVGNISHVDVQLLTRSTDLPLLRSSCIHFISVILSERGMTDGKDSFPVFYINPGTTLAHTIAKLVATRSHRMWIVDAPSASPIVSTPATPSAATTPAPFGQWNTPTTPGLPYTPALGTSVSASNMPGQHTSGRLSGVISLTDVLNLFARASGLSPLDPSEARNARRRSSSSSMRVSMDSARSSSVDLSRPGSIGGRR